ncbi:MAG TPA: hypothetical protein VLD67_19010 [Vicinamibacterales bacterium]|nr:hypothetical protein [Vicinamibacterales bacterium]
MTTGVAPPVDPILGEMDMTTGGGTSGSEAYVYPPVSAALRPSRFVTTTSTVPVACAAVLATMVVLLSTMTLVAMPPIVKLAPVWNPLPDTATAVPPSGTPLLGEMVVTVSAAVDWPALD